MEYFMSYGKSNRDTVYGIAVTEYY